MPSPQPTTETPTPEPETALPPGTVGIFVGYDGDKAVLYLFDNTRAEAPRVLLTTDREIDYPVISPSRKYVAYLEVDVQGGVLLVVVDAEGKEIAAWNPNEGDLARSRIAWSPDGATILVTLVGRNDSEDVPAVYALDVSRGPGSLMDDDATPHLLIPNAAAPSFSPDGQFIAFERPGELSRAFVWVISIGQEQILNALPEGPSCFAPVFGSDSISSVYMICLKADGTRGLFRFSGQDTLEEIPLNLPDTADRNRIGNLALIMPRDPENQNQMPSWGDILTFDDEIAIYVVNLPDGDGEPSTAPNLLNLTNVKHIYWWRSHEEQARQVASSGK